MRGLDKPPTDYSVFCLDRLIPGKSQSPVLLEAPVRNLRGSKTVSQPAELAAYPHAAAEAQLNIQSRSIGQD